MKSLAGIERKLADKNLGKINKDNKMVREKVLQQLSIAQNPKFAFKIKKYGNWIDC